MLAANPSKIMTHTFFFDHLAAPQYTYRNRIRSKANAQNDPGGIRTPNRQIWSLTRYRCATEPMTLQCRCGQAQGSREGDRW